MARPLKKEITPREKEFARLIVEAGLGSIQAARKVFGWKCEPESREAQQARDLARTPRVLAYMKILKVTLEKQSDAETIIQDSGKIEWDQLRKFAFKRLTEIRDNAQANAQVRFNAIEALEQLEDPNKDINLIWKWIDLVWRGTQAHCPCCHQSFPLWKVKNAGLKEFRQKMDLPKDDPVETTLERRLELLAKMDKRKTPHPGQLIALGAPERHVAGLGAARGGKSLLLAWFAAMTVLLPGVEIWILAQTFDAARKEVEYLKKFLATLFYPYASHLFSERFDSKTGELILTTRWGSELRVRSSKAKGSITASELELALVAEPGWVPEDIYEELRARMSSRLGRIIVLGTPKGFGGFLGRMVNLTGRDPKTGKVIRRTPEERKISSGCPWNVSMLVYTLNPKDNPEYVQSELAAARMELTDTEFESEFEGRMSSIEGSKFGQIQPRHCRHIDRDTFSNCIYIVGVDQGERNFGGVLVGWDGQKVYVGQEYFENGDNTIRTNMKEVQRLAPTWIRKIGGQPDEWKLTIFDRDPPIWNIIGEMEQEGSPWPTEWVMRHKNKKVLGDNWRKETSEFINELARNDRLFFDLEHCDLLHDQLMRAIDRPMSDDKDRESDSNKGWIINDPWRGDHVCDAFMLVMWTIFTNQVQKLAPVVKALDPYSEHKAAFDFQRAMDERRQMSGTDGRKAPDVNSEFQKYFGRDRGSPIFTPKKYGFYDDYS